MCFHQNSVIASLVIILHLLKLMNVLMLTLEHPFSALQHFNDYKPIKVNFTR